MVQGLPEAVREAVREGSWRCFFCFCFEEVFFFLRGFFLKDFFVLGEKFRKTKDVVTSKSFL